MPFTRLLICSMFGMLAIAMLGACTQGNNYGPAPLGEKAALEKLANAYRKESAKLTVSPTGMTPAARRKFLEQTFHAAGYDYSATLIALSTVASPTVNQYHKDLKQLLYLPHFDHRLMQLSDIYSKKEIAAIHAIDANIH